MRFLRSCIYELGLVVLALFQLPKVAKWKKHLGRSFPVLSTKRPIAWIHAVSLGETKAITALAEELQDNYALIISSVTNTGHEEAKKALPFALAHVYLPFDFSWIIRPILAKVSPKLLVISETDLWFNFIDAAKKRGAQVALVNGKLSEKSLRRYKSIFWFAKPLFETIDLYCVQNGSYKSRFEQMGIPQTKLVVTGNMKFDVPFPKGDIDAIRDAFGIKPKAQVLVIASTHDPEERLLIDAILKMKPSHLKILLAPRHPERFEEVANLLVGKGVAFSRFSKQESDKDWILIDAMGQLNACYQVADLAIVGGSFTEGVGGHNILEPCAYGVPVIFGPYMHSQKDLASLVKSYRAGKQLTISTLSSELERLLADQRELSDLGLAGLRMVEEAKGATSRTVEVLQKLF